MVRIAHIADVHLGACCTHLGDKADMRKMDFEFTFERVIDTCCNQENRIDALIIAGDLFDMASPPSSLVGFVQKSIARLQESGIPVLIVPGTHDGYGYRESVYKTYPFTGADILSFPVFSPVVKTLSGMKVFFYGMAYIPGYTCNPFQSFTPVREEGIHIGILHGALEKPSHGKGQNLLITGEDIAKSDLDYLALGHYHTYQEHQFGKTVVVCPGSLEGITLSERGERFMVIADFGRGNPPQIEKIRVNTRTIQDISLNSDHVESVEDLTTLIESCGDTDSIIRVTLRGSLNIPIDIQFLEDVLSDTFFHIKIVDETTVEESSLVKSWATEKTIRGMFTSRIVEKINEAEGDEKLMLKEALKIGVNHFRKVSL
ncbi:MAG: DNA repair exonuclease [Theionarchaea archaeon]|nr:DNA repair exonuclease [Theionarchaea archaeon]